MPLGGVPKRPGGAHSYLCLLLRGQQGVEREHVEGQRRIRLCTCRESRAGWYSPPPAGAHLRLPRVPLPVALATRRRPPPPQTSTVWAESERLLEALQAPRPSSGGGGGDAHPAGESAAKNLATSPTASWVPPGNPQGRGPISVQGALGSGSPPKPALRPAFTQQS